MLHGVSGGLVATSMVTPPECAELLRHAAGFPALPAHRLFLEYRVGTSMGLEGYGHGYDGATLASLLRTGGSFTAGPRLRDVMTADPFASDRRRYLDIEADRDPAWIEYDHANGGFSDAPGAFFAFPARFRLIADEAQARALRSRLDPLLRPPETGDDATFWDLLDVLVRSAPASRPVGLYRLGLCAGRRPGWIRVVLNNLSRQSLDPLAALPGLGANPDPIGWVVDHLAEAGEADPQIAASVTVVGGTVDAVDLECPYFHRIADDAERVARVAAFCRHLADRGLVTPSIAELLSGAAVVHLRSDDGAVEGLLLLNHLKFGVAGSTRGRVKAYFELLVRTND